MPIGGYYNNSSSLLRALAPPTSYAQMSAQKDRELQYAMALTEQARVDQQEQERKIQLSQQTLAQLKSLPFEGPDQRRIKSWVLDREKEVAKRIETEYNGDTQKFIDVEGMNWLQNTTSQLQSSDLYNAAQQNKEMIAMAKEAIKKNHNLIGKLGPDGSYVTAEQEMLNYYSGAAPTFNFDGSYDPKSSVIDHFGKLDNPYGSKYDQLASVPAEDVLGYLRSEKGDRAAQDLWFRDYKNKNVGYKKYSIEDKQMFDLGVMDKESAIASRAASTAANLAKAQNEEADKVNNAKTYNERTLGNPLTVNELVSFDKTTNIIDSAIPNLGIKVSDLFEKNAGKATIKMTKYDFSRGSEAANESVGITERVVNGKKRYTGEIPGILTTDGSPKYVDLGKIKHTVIKSDPYIYLDGGDKVASTTQGGPPKRAWKYYEVLIRKDDAPKDAVNGLKTEVKKDKNGKGVEFYRIKGYTGLPDIWNNEMLNFDLSKQIGGQKQTNEIFNSAPSVEIADWDYEN
ncbi:hypothetical protein [Dyadobacter sp. CY312]|uniref:hypothetical protein n=1 Tax=Dyadobacter sp. CY312 TaxID=2907303 RepID=UPI001F2E623E|nr:hypothetical protein [Dyadobacter sp. CY312]MCE7039235.1 hypothetical protein [Dyadobacter sp. CY312]